MQGTAKKPSRWWYAIGAAVIVLGLGGAYLYGISQASKLLPDVRVVAPGTNEVQLDHAGKYTVFYEYNSVVDGHTYSTDESPPAISSGLVAKAASQPVELSRPPGKSSYTVNEYVGTSVLEFSIDDPGTYVFTARYEQGRTGPDIVFAIGKDNSGRFLAGFLGMGLGGLALGTFIIVHHVREMAHRRQQSENRLHARCRQHIGAKNAQRLVGASPGACFRMDAYVEGPKSNRASLLG